MMKIAHIVWGLGIGGIENMLVDIVNIQCRTQIVSIFVVNDIVDDDILSSLDTRVRVFQIRRQIKSRNPYPIIKLNLLLKKFKPDIIHCHDAFFSRLLFIQGHKLVTFHNMYLPIDYVNRYELCCSISKEVQNDLQNRGVDSIVVENGIPASRILVKQFFSKSDEFHIIQVARVFFEQKGQDILVSALERLLARTHRNVFVHFVGDGPDMMKLKEMITKRGLLSNVILEGSKSREWIFSHLKDYDLFVLPSRFEGFGLCVAEACAACLPVIVSNSNGPMEIIDNGKYGWTFKSLDADDLAQKIEDVMENRYPSEMISAARENALAKYDISNTVFGYKRVYDILYHKQQI